MRARNTRASALHYLPVPLRGTGSQVSKTKPVASFQTCDGREVTKEFVSTSSHGVQILPIFSGRRQKAVNSHSKCVSDRSQQCRFRLVFSAENVAERHLADAGLLRELVGRPAESIQFSANGYRQRFAGLFGCHDHAPNTTESFTIVNKTSASEPTGRIATPENVTGVECCAQEFDDPHGLHARFASYAAPQVPWPFPDDVQGRQLRLF